MRIFLSLTQHKHRILKIILLLLENETAKRRLEARDQRALIVVIDKPKVSNYEVR